ncbi:hypothetical protein VSH64_37720 [Amycolatopsis rhabdoformis]|uniref:Flagellar basal body-associated protein FliL n=1 Tax=Amycolatopsis rhabdoformis TaxID=1448059 RepID=A0ABZ1I2D8_9PSEU|nr:hypothetical protein [Amycolatopsis rhabdoformis]WSE28528.1 hypothetical protein VSH64_37720 [Amycolatopsis rhabdoformis]
MSWQEELRRLDEELASGRLSADDYRIRRDQVLSSAVGQQDQPAPQQPNPSADSTQIITPVSPPQGMPQQQAPQQPAPQQPPADPSAERTQAVQPWQMQQHSDPARTEYVQPQQQPPQAQYSPPGGFQQPASPAGGFPQQTPWNAADSDQSPPWGGGDLPPLGPSGNDSFRQGPEFFTEKPKGGNGKKIGAIVGAVVVLAAIAFGAYWLWGRGTSTAEQPPAQPTQQAPSSAPKPPDPMAVADLPGAAEKYDSIKNFTQIPALNYLTSDELSTYEAAQASDVKFVVHDLGGGARVIVMLTKVSSPSAAQSAASKLLATQIRNDATRVDGAPDGVFVTSVDAKDSTPAQIRGHYVHDNVVVRIEVTAPGSLQTAKTNFDSILAAQLKALPSNG